MRLLFKLTVILVVLLGLACVAGLFLDPAWEVSRSIVIDASSAEVHPHLANLKNWEAWSPFEAEDPDIHIVYSGPRSGAGARREWTSTVVGNGWMEITAADPDKGVWYDLQLEDMPGFKGIMIYAPVDGGTRVTWTDRGDMGSNVLYRWFGLLADAMLGSTFEDGLAKLKTTVEQG